MILQPARNPQPNINRVLCYLAAFFGSGVALILLNALYEALNEYGALFSRILAFSAVVLILSLVAYVSISILLTIEYRATQNQIFKEQRQQFQLASDNDNRENIQSDKEQQILSLYDEMTFTNSLSYNQIALEVFGGKSGVYTKQIKDILVKNGREI